MGNIREILRDAASPLVLPALSQGVIIGVLLVVIEVSFASMIFSGPLAEFATRAAGMTVFGAMAFSLCTGLFSPFKSMISLPQDSPVAVLSGTSAAIAGALAAATPQAQFSTVAAVMALSAFITAGVFLLVGGFRLSNLVRFLPYPVVGGFLAGSGVTLTMGGLGVSTGVSFSFDTLGAYASWPVAQFWLPAAAYALIVFALMKLRPHFMILPISLGLGMAAFYAAMAWSGVSVPEARDGGWLLASLPGSGLWPAFGPNDLAVVDWGVVVSALPDMLTAALLSLVGLLLNVGGIELGARQDIDMDRELLVGAAGNALGGMGGAFAGFSTLSLSLLGPRTGTNTRLIPLFSALVCAGVLFLGAEALTFFPKALLGGLVLLLGLFFLDDWVFTSWRRLSVSDYCIVLVIMAAIARFGFLEGVGLGLMLAVFFFVFRLSRVPVVAEHAAGDIVSSGRPRSVPDKKLLAKRGREMQVFTLRGYVFFGSANALAGAAERFLKGTEEPLHSLVIDLSGIDGFDISAVNVFQRMAQQAQARSAWLVFAGAPQEFRTLLERNTSAGAMEQVCFHSSREAALAWCEDDLLDREHGLLEHSGEGARNELFDMSADDLDEHLRELELFEQIVQRMENYGTRQNLSDGQTLVEPDRGACAAYFVLFGEMTERPSTVSAAPERSVGQGEVAAPSSAYGQDHAAAELVSRGRTEVFRLECSDFERLEKDDPATAVAVHRLLSQAFTRGT